MRIAAEPPPTAGNWRSSSIAKRPASAPGMRCSRVLRLLNPAATEPARLHQEAGLRCRHGLRRSLPSSDSSHRPSESQGKEQRLRRPCPTTLAAPGRSAPRKAVTRPSIRSWERSRISSSFVSRARQLGLEVALDLAYQCAPDHPYVKEHKEWFRIRPDGTRAVCRESAQEVSGHLSS